MTALFFTTGCGESTKVQLTRFRKEAAEQMTRTCAVELSGYRRVIHSRVDSESADPADWHGFVVAEYTSPVGSIDRTNLQFLFMVERPDAGDERIFCYADNRMIAQQNR